MIRTQTLRALPVLLLLLLAAPGGASAATGAQDAGAAAISFPRQAEPIAGQVEITGTAAHPQFDRYELAFAYDPNPTGTWFPIGDPGRAPVQDGRLAAWDVSGITGGRYALRLRVFGLDGTSLEAVVGGVIIQNNPPTPTPPPATPTPLIEATPTPPPEPSPISEAVVAAPTATVPRSESADQGGRTAGDSPISGKEIRRAFCTGVAWTFAVFLIAGAYAGLRASLRPRLRRWLRETLENLQR